ncbi:structural maintenance of chromosomes protein 5-like isoform X2 [Daphnia pulex]|nr:structural maintenance of chromosomes protein 5-like isoform X2 [Daphnia pulex]
MQGQLGSESLNQEKDELELKKLQEENKRWESDVKSFKERETLKANVKNLEKKKVWLTFKEELSHFKNLKEKAIEIGKRYAKAASRFEPLEKTIAEKEKTVRDAEAAVKLKRDKFNQKTATMNQEMYRADAHKQKMESLASDFQAKKLAERKRIENEQSFRQQILNLEKDLEALDEQEKNSSAELEDIDARLNAIAPHETALAQRKHVLAEEMRRLRYEINEFQSKVKSIEDIDKNRLNLLRADRGLTPVYEAVMWLRENKNKFRAPIHEPPLISLSVKDTKMAKYVENSIGFNDMKAFYCENKDDMNDLMKILREDRHLPVNVVHSPRNDNEPLTSEFQPRMAISDLKDLGFHSFLRELFVGPEPVVRYLCKMYKVHNIPVGDQRAYENFGVIRNQYGSLFPTFFGGNQQIVVRGSRYSRNAITQMSEIRPSRFLDQTVDTCVLEQYYAKIAQLEQRLAQNKADEVKISQDEIGVNKAREDLVKQKRSIQGIQANRRVVVSRLERVRAQLMRSEKEAVDLVGEERNVKEKCGIAVRALSKKLKEFSKLMDQLLVQDMEREALQIHLDILRVEIHAAKNQLAEEKEQIVSLKDEKDEAGRMAEEAKLRAKRAQEDAYRCLRIRVKEELTAEVRAMFELLPNTIPEIDEAIGSATARIQLMGRADEQIVRDYAAREILIEQLTKKINNINSRATSMKDKIDKLKEKFLPPLLQLISHINHSFGRFYASMNCVGEVCLHTGEGENDDDFRNYGIKIRVKYRSSEPLLDLSGTHHSGGERAVATALYMLAMQELTQVPFRCVDEINQGMDPINERRVFDLLVETACRETSAQYFLLTPKLLPGLDYSPNMKIHFVQNGEYVCDGWNIDKHLQTIRAMNIQN